MDVLYIRFRSTCTAQALKTTLLGPLFYPNATYRCWDSDQVGEYDHPPYGVEGKVRWMYVGVRPYHLLTFSPVSISGNIQQSTSYPFCSALDSKGTALDYNDFLIGAVHESPDT